MTSGPLDPARLPPTDLDGLDPSWSRLVSAPLSDGERTFHLLDTMPEGDAELTLLCVHGNPSWSYLWRHLLADLPAGVRAIAIDHIDMGFSERTGTVRRLADRIDDLCALTDTLGLTGPVVTVAHDWGGPISLGWAQRHLEQLRGVVLTNTAVHQPENASAPRVIRAARTRGALQRTTVDTTTFINGAFEMSHPRTPKHIRRGFLAPYEAKERRLAIKTFVEDIPLEDDHPTASTLDGVAAGLEQLADTPTLLLWGARDLVFSDLYLHDLEARLPHADVHRWPHAGHFVTEDADVATAVVDWISTLGDKTVGTSESSAISRLLEHVDNPSDPDKVAITEMSGDQPSSISFGELDARVERTAGGLRALGVQPGERVAVMIPPGIDLGAVVYACWKVGAVVVLVDGALSPKQMGAALSAAFPKYLIGIPKALAAARAMRWPGRRIAPEPQSRVASAMLGIEDDLESLCARGTSASSDAPPANNEAAVVFTSGSTGPSKGVRYTHEQIAAQRDAIVDLYDITTDDALVAAFAPFALYGPMMGVSSVVPDMDVSLPGTLDAGSVAEAVASIDATMVFASPAALENITRTSTSVHPDHVDALANVRLLLSAGAPVRASLLSGMGAVLPNATAHTPYGMTEVLPVASISFPELEAAGSGDGVCVGRPLPGVDVTIESLSPNTKLGEIVARAAHMRSSYDRLWHTTHLASQPSGWHRTGDVGWLDDDGHLWVCGRLNHVLWTADGPLGPVGLEKAIESIDGVYSAAVVGVGPRGLAQTVAVLQLDDEAGKPGIADLALSDAVRSISDRDVVAVLVAPSLPVDRRHNSKIDRAAVKSWAERALSGGPIGKL